MKIGETIYLDHQATTPVDRRVLAEMAPYFGESFGNPHSSDHSLGWESARAIDKAAARVARLIGCGPRRNHLHLRRNRIKQHGVAGARTQGRRG